jgi:chemotaxis protein methyltransferase CheR
VIANVATDLPADDFEYLCRLMHDRAAIVLEPGKEYLALSRLDPIAREAGVASVAALVDVLRAESDASRLHERVVDALTTNETTFFRDHNPFESLRTHVLPDLIGERRRSRSLAIWSAGCSSGQEPYSIAMAVREHFPELLTWRLTILGTDISPSVLDRARRGHYGQLEVNRGLPAHLLVRHFTRAGMEWEVAPGLRRMITASECNLAAPLPRMGPFDVVYLRNVLIYFDLPTKQAILRRVRELMRPDGWLFLGAAETTLGVDDQWERVVIGRSSAYRPLKGA